MTLTHTDALAAVRRDCKGRGRSRAPLALLAVASIALLAACGGGGSDDSGTTSGTLTITGTAADGPLAGAIACYDLTDNGACDPSEPTSAPTGADGRWSIVIQAADAGLHDVVVEVPATATDADTGAAVGTAFTMRAPTAEGQTDVFVSPLTSLVVAEAAASGSSTSDAAAAVQARLGIAFSPLDDFVRPAGGRSAASDQAANAARLVGAVTIEVSRLASAAGVSPADTRSLVDSTARASLPAVGAAAARYTDRIPVADIAEGVQDVLAARNLSGTTVAAQAAVATRANAPLAADTPDAFVSLRSFTYASASDYNLRVFVGDSRQLDAGGAFVADELRQVLVGGVPQPFNRNQVYWTGSEWNVCEREWQVVKTVAQSASQPQRSTYCGASKSESRVHWADVSGRRMADVVAEIRAFPLPDTTGLPSDWGPDPALVGDTVFPAGSSLSTRSQVTDLGGTIRYQLLDKPRVLPAYEHAADFAALKAMAGDIVDAGATVTSANTVFLDDTAVTTADPALRPLKRHRLGFDPASDLVVFYDCDVRAADNVSINCARVASGASTISTLGNARVLRLPATYPPEALLALHRKRLFVERDGVVFGGYEDLQREVHQQRPNTTAWIALRDRLGIPAHAAAMPPASGGPIDFVRTFTYGDAGNYGYRRFSGDGIADGTGTFTASDLRVNVSGGALQPFAFNSEFWTGTDWYACPNDLNGVLRYRLDPRESTYCRAFVNTTTEPVVVTLDGRNMAEVLRDIRWYPSKDGVFDFSGYGPNPDTTPLLAAGAFPAGSTMYYQRIDQVREPEQVFLGNANLVRNAPSPTSAAPYDTWPVATTLEEAIAFNPGNYAGGPLNGNVTLNVARYFVASPPDPAYTTEIGFRVAFDANGQRARVFRHNVSASNGRTVNYVAVLDTTYTIETIGGHRVLKFAQLPAEVLDRVGQSRIFVQRAGEVRFGQQTRIFPGGQHTIRLNGVAADALFAQLGVIRP